MATLTNKNGTSASDTLTYDQGGTGVVYNTGAGNDKVYIVGGSITVINDSGNDTFNVTGGSGHNITGGANADTVNINGANIVEGNLGSGRDIINIKNSSGRKDKGAMSVIRGGEWTDTFTIEAGATYYQLYGDAGDDIFEVKGGNNIILWGGAAIDTFTVTGGTGIKLRGGDSADVYNINAEAVDMQLGYGNDVVNVNSGNNHTIKANLGINTINLLAGRGHVITSDIDQAASQKAGREVGYGVDKVFLTGTATYVTANLGDGKDEVTVSKGYGHKIYTEGWGDTINISGTVSNSWFDAGAGDDIYNVQWNNIGTNNVIDQTTASKADKDVLNITDKRFSEFDFSIDGISLFIKNRKTGRILEVRGWETGLRSISFVDGTYSVEQLFKEKVIEDGRAYSTLVQGSATQGDLSGYKVTLIDGSAQNITGAKTDKGGATGNAVVVEGGSVRGKVIAAEVGDGTAAVNTVTVTGGSVGEIYGAKGNTALVKDNKVEMTGGTVNKLYAGYTASGTAENNSLELGGTAVVNGDAYINYSETGSTGDGSATIKEQAEIKGTLYGGAGADTIKVEGGSIGAVNSGAGADDISIYNGKIGTLSSGEGDDVIKVTNGTIGILNSGAGADTIEVNGDTVGTLDSGTGADTVNVNGGEITSLSTGDGDDFIAINGGKVDNLASGQGNDTLIIDGGQVDRVVTGEGDDTITLKDGSVKFIEGGLGKDTITLDWEKVGDGLVLNQTSAGQGDEDSLTIENATSKDFTFGLEDGIFTLTDKNGKTMEIQGWDKGLNSITFDDKTITGEDFFKLLVLDDGVDYGRIQFKQSEEEELTNYRVELVDGKVSGIETATSKDGKVSNNKILITGGSVDGDGNLIAGQTEKGDAIGNVVTVAGAQVKLQGIVIGGQSLEGKATGNQVELSTGEYEAVYGGLTNSGLAADNKVEIKGDTLVKGNVYINGVQNGGTGTTGDGQALVGGTAEIQGTLYGGAGVDTITIEGGTVGAVDTGSGSDIVEISNGTIGNLDSGAGKDELTLIDSTVGTINSGDDNDTITLTNSEVGTINVGSGADTITISGGTVETLESGEGDDIIAATDVQLGSILGGSGNDTITISGGTAEAIGGGDGDDIISINADQVDKVEGGTGADTITVTAGKLGIIDSGAGADTIIVNGGQVDTILGDEDQVTIQEGTIGLIQGGASADTIRVEAGSVDRIITGDGADVITIAGGSVSYIEAGLGKDTFSINWNQLEGLLVIDQTSAGLRDRDELTIVGSDSTNFNFSLKDGIFTMIDDNGKKMEIHGWDNGMNSITFDDKTLSGDDFFPVMDKELVISDGATYEDIRFSQPLDGEKAGYTVKLLDGTANSVTTVFDTNNPTDIDDFYVVTAKDNEIIVGGNGVVKKSGDLGGDATAAYIVNGVATGNQATLNGGRVEGSLSGADIIQGSASGNKVLINSGEVAEAYGAKSATAEVKNNAVEVLGGTAEKVVGATSSQGIVKDNTVTISGGSVDTVYGGYAEAGRAEGNSVILNGNGVVDQVYTNFSESGSVGAGSVTVDGDAQVKGTVYGCEAVDTLTVKGGTVNIIDGQAGADIISIQGGEVQLAMGGAGADNITITGGVTTKIEGGADADVITISGGEVVTVDGGASGDTLNINGGIVGTVIGGAGKDTIVVDWSKCNDGIVIDQTTAGATDGDVLKILNAANFIFDLEGDVLSMTDADGKTLKVKGWGQGTNSITFDDTTLTGDDFFRTLIIKDGKSYGLVKLSKTDSGDIHDHTVILQKGTVNEVYAAFDTTNPAEAASSAEVNAYDNHIEVQAAGKVEAADGMKGEVISAYVVKGAATENTATVTGGVIEGSITAAKVEQGNATNNQVDISGGEIAAAYGARGGQAGVKNNTINMTGGQVENLYGGSSVSGTVENNTINMTGGQADYIYGGTSESGTVRNNTVALGGQAIVNNDVYLSYSSAGNAGAGIATVEGDAEIKGTIYGSNSGDTITVEGGQVNIIDGQTGTDTITVKGGSVNTLRGGANNDTITLLGGQVQLVEGGANNDTITVAGGIVGTIDAGTGKDTISIDWSKLTNNVVIDQTTAATSDGDIIKIVNENSYNFSFALVEGSLIVADDDGKHRLEIRGWGKGTNSITFDDKTLTGSDFFPTETKKLIILDGQNHGDIKLATVNQGQADQYIVKLLDGQADNIYAAYDTNTSGTTKVTATGNTVVLGANGQVAGDIAAAYVYNGAASGNIASVQGGTVNTVYGAKSAVGELSDNQVVVSAGQVKDIYGGYSNSGAVQDNTVTIEGDALVTGDVYSNYSQTGTVGQGTITIKDQAQVEGTVYGGNGDDTINVEGGQVALIELNSGTDIVNISGGRVEELTTTQNTTTVNVEGGTLGKIDLSNLGIAMNISGGVVEEIITGTVAAENNVLTLGSKSSTVTLTEGVIENIYSASPVNIKNSQLEETTLHGSNSTSQFTLEKSQLGGLVGGSGADTVTLKSSSVVDNMDLGAGSNTINVTSSEILNLSGNGGTETVKLNTGKVVITEGTVETVNLESGTNVLEIKDSSVTKLTGGTGSDTVKLENAQVEISNSSSSNKVERVDFVEGNNILIVSSSTTIDAVTGGAGDDHINMKGGTVTLTQGEIEQVEINGSSTFNVNGGKVDDIAINTGTGWVNVYVNVNDGEVGHIDLSNSRTSLYSNGGVIDMVEGNTIAKASWGNNINVDNASVYMEGGTINKFVARKKGTIENFSAQGLYGTDGDNELYVLRNGYVDVLDTGEGNDLVTVSESTVDTLIVKGGRNTINLGQPAQNQWSQATAGTVNNLILESGINNVTCASSDSRIGTLVANGERDMVTVAGGEVEIIEGTVEVLKVLGGGDNPATITLNGGNIGMLSAGGSGAKSPTINIIKGTIGSIAIVYANSENMMGGGMTFENADNLGFVRAGYANGEDATTDSIANSGRLTLKNCANIEGVCAGYAEAVNSQFSTNAMGNNVDISGDSHIGKIYGGYTDAYGTGVVYGPVTHTNHNKVNILDENATISVDYICAAYAKDTGFAPALEDRAQSYCQISYNQVNIAVKNADLEEVYCSISENSPGRVTKNELNFTGSANGHLNIEKLYGGFATGGGNCGLTYMSGNDNVATVSNVTYLGEAYGGAADTGSLAMFNDVVINGVQRAGKLYAGYADCASAEYNYLTLNDGVSVDEVYVAYNTAVNIGITYMNTAKLKNSSIEVLYGGYTDVNCTYGAMENKAYVTNCTLGTVYVSYNAATKSSVDQSSSTTGIPPSYGGCEENQVALLGNTVVTGDVYVNYAASTGNANGNLLYVGGTSQVKGTIQGNGREDIIGIYGGTANTINAGGGNDKLRIKAGSVARADGGAGEDQLMVTGGRVGQLLGGSGVDTIVVDCREEENQLIQVADISGGLDNDRIVVRGVYEAGTSEANTVNGGNGDDYIELKTDNCKGAFGGAGQDIILVEGNNNVISGDGEADIIQISAGTANTISVGQGNDTIVVKGAKTVTGLTIDYVGSDVAQVVLEGVTLDQLSSEQSAAGWSFSYGESDFTITGDTGYNTIIYCDNGALRYNAGSYVKDSSTSYSGNALEQIETAAAELKTAGNSYLFFDNDYFKESELRVSGNS